MGTGEKREKREGEEGRRGEEERGGGEGRGGEEGEGECTKDLAIILWMSVWIWSTTIIHEGQQLTKLYTQQCTLFP